MKKLFASLLAATMVAGMAVSAFAYANAKLEDFDGVSTALIIDTNDSKNNTAVISANDEKDDYSLAKVIYKGSFDAKNDETVEEGDKVDGDKLYFPIIVNDEVYNDDSKGDHVAANKNKYVYATKASEIEDVKAKVKATIGGKYIEKEANIVKREIKFITQKADTNTNTEEKSNRAKVYCVEVKTADFTDIEEKEIEFDLTLYNKSKKQIELEDINFTFGSDAKDIVASDDEWEEVKDDFEDEFSKKPKFKTKDGDLTLYLKKDAKAYKLDEVEGTDVERITLEIEEADNEATFEVAASSQDDLFLGYSIDANKALVVANPDAEVQFLDFDANPTFDFMGTLRLTVEDPEKTNFCYEVKDGKVTPVGKYNAEDECFEIRTRQLTSYVLSDKELVNAATAEEEKPADKPAEEKPADKVVPSGALA